jgi:methionine aminotransferase
MSGLANEYQALNLAQGFPNFDCPPGLMDRVEHHMRKGRNQYAPMPGVPELKEQIADKVETLYGAQYDPDTEITVTAGATQGLYAVLTTVIGEGDEVIVIEPAFDAYRPMIELNKGVPKYVKLQPPDFQIDWQEVRQQISSATRAILINTPHNPSGMVMQEADLAQLEQIAASHDLFIISDEVYEHMVFDGQEHLSVCRYPHIRQKSFAVFSFGKTYHTTGWKVGYVLAPQDLTAEMRKVFQYIMFAVSTPMQYAYADYLQHKAHYLELHDFYQEKRDSFARMLQGSRFNLLPCPGTYFQVADYSAITDEPDVDLCKRLITDHGLAAVPISVFYSDKIDNQVIRFCFAKDDETLEKGAEILCQL